MDTSSDEGSWVFDAAKIHRIMCVARTALTYAVIDTHVSLIDFLPALFCHKRAMYAHAAVVIHLVYYGAFGWMLRDCFENTNAVIGIMQRILREKTKLPAEMVDEIASKRMFLNADACLKYGLVDEIIGA